MKSSSMDHRTRVTRMLIRKALTDLLSRKPIQSITVKELCAQAGINRGTFYTHYEDIYLLLRQIEYDMLADLTRALEPLSQTAGTEKYLMDASAGIFQCLKENLDLCVVMLGDFSDRDFVSRLLAIGKEACLNAYAPYFEGMNPSYIEYFYAFVSQGCIGLLRHWLDEGMTMPAQDLARMAEGIIVNGVGSLHGQRE